MNSPRGTRRQKVRYRNHIQIPWKTYGAHNSKTVSLMQSFRYGAQKRITYNNNLRIISCNYILNSRQQTFLHVPRSHGTNDIKYDYRNDCLENYFHWQVTSTSTITWITPCKLFTWYSCGPFLDLMWVSHPNQDHIPSDAKCSRNFPWELLLVIC